MTPQATLILRRMASELNPSSNAGPKFSGHKSLCHLKVARAIQRRGRVDDKVWLLGMANVVSHSILTDANNRIVEDSSQGKFSSGVYFQPGTGTTTPLDVIEIVYVSDLYDDFMEY